MKKANPEEKKEEGLKMLKTISEDFERTANFHLNLSKTYTNDYIQTINRRKVELQNWQDLNLLEVYSAASNYFENYILYLKNKIESHQKYYQLFAKKFNLISFYFTSKKESASFLNLHSSFDKIKNFIDSKKNSSSSKEFTSDEESLNSNIDKNFLYSNENNEKDEKNNTTENLTSNTQNQKETKSQQEITLQNFSSIFSIEDILLKTNSIKLDPNIQLLEVQIDALQLVVDDLYIEYEKAKEKFRKRSKAERKAEIETLLENAVIESISLVSIKENIKTENSVFYHSFDKKLFEKFENFLSDKRYKEGIFASRWLNLVKSSQNSKNHKNSKNKNPKGEKGEKLFGKEKTQKGEFYEKLVNETVRIIKNQYSLEMEMSTKTKHGDATFNALQLEVERFYFSKIRSSIFEVLKNAKTEEENSNFLENQKRLKEILKSEENSNFANLIEIKESLNEKIFFEEAIEAFEKSVIFDAPTDIIYCFVKGVRKICGILNASNSSNGFNELKKNKASKNSNEIKKNLKEENDKGNEEMLSADKIFPYVVFCLVHSNVKNIHSVFNYLTYVAEKDMENGEVGVCASMVCAAAVFISSFQE